MMKMLTIEEISIVSGGNVYFDIGSFWGSVTANTVDLIQSGAVGTFTTIVAAGIAVTIAGK